MSMALFEAQLKRNRDKFEQEYMPLFRIWCNDNPNKRVWEISQDEEAIGTLLNRLRTGNTRVPHVFLKEMNSLGYMGGKAYNLCKWQLVYVPLFRKWCVDNPKKEVFERNE